MNAQQWITAVVAVLGYAATLLGSWLSGRRAHALAVYQRRMDRIDAWADVRDRAFRDFLAAARVLRHPGEGAAWAAV